MLARTRWRSGCLNGAELGVVTRLCYTCRDSTFVLTPTRIGDYDGLLPMSKACRPFRPSLAVAGPSREDTWGEEKDDTR